MGINTYSELKNNLEFLNDRLNNLKNVEGLVGEELTSLEKEIEESKKQVLAEFQSLENFINTIEDEQIKKIVWYKVVKDCTFEEIGRRIGYTRSSAWKLYEKANIESKYKEYKRVEIGNKRNKQVC